MTKPNRKMVETLVNLSTNGALDRIDQRGKRARELYQWGLHPHHAEEGSPLAADNAAFEAAYPIALSGVVGVTEESPLSFSLRCHGIGHLRRSSDCRPSIAVCVCYDMLLQM